MKSIQILLPVLAVLASFISCNNEEGVGGRSSVGGYVYKVLINDDLSRDTFLARDERVHIYFGKTSNMADKTDTGFDGFFKFQFLREGTYTVCAFTDLVSDEKIPIKQTISVTGKNKDFIVDPIYIEKGKSLGRYYVTGLLTAKYIKKNTTSLVIDSARVTDKPRPYLRKPNDPTFIEDARPVEGEYAFTRLLPDTYQIYVQYELPNESNTTLCLEFELKEDGTIFLKKYTDENGIETILNKESDDLGVICTRINV